MWRGRGPCLRIIDTEMMIAIISAVPSFGDVPPSAPWRFVFYGICHSHLLLVSLIAVTKVPFSVRLKLGEKLSPMTHFSSVARFHGSEDGAGRFSENVFKMLSERYVAAIKPAACVHSLLSSPVHVCTVASPLLSLKAHVGPLLSCLLNGKESQLYTMNSSSSVILFPTSVRILHISGSCFWSAVCACVYRAANIYLCY